MLPCLSCKQEVSPEDGKVFAQVFLCPSCHEIAKRLYARGQQELRMMMLVLKESIRLAALQGELQFSLQNLADMKKEDLLAHLSKLASEAKKSAVPVKVDEPMGDVRWKQRKILERIPSEGTTSPPALPAAGKPDSSSTSG